MISPSWEKIDRGGKMNKSGILSVGVAITIGSMLCPLEASDVWSDCISRDVSLSQPPASTLEEPTHYLGNFNFPELSADDSFSTYVYTYGDIVIFSYANDNACRMSDGNGVIWSDTMTEDDYQLITGLQAGVYKVDIPRRAAVLSGDPFMKGLCCWFATGPDNRPLGTKLLTVGPSAKPESEGILAVWAYENGTDVTVKNLTANSVEWEGTLDSAEYYANFQGANPPIVYSVAASKPVSVQEMSGVNGTYVPAFNGTFTGRDFMTYQHYYDAPQDINIVPWEDNTTVDITTLGDPADTVWHVVCPNRGEIKGTSMPTKRALYIHSDKDISVSQTEWASFGGGMVAFYTARGIDRNGLGLGTEFFIPLEPSVSWTLNIYSRLHVVAFRDSTSVTVTRIPSEGGNETSIWSGILNRGEYYRYSCPLDDPAGKAIYHVVSSQPVTTVGSCYDGQGSDFYPVEQLYASAISENPSVELTQFKIITSIGSQIVMSYFNCPNGLRASVYDAGGRRVDEIITPNQSGVLVWGPRQNPGVYFIVPQGGKTTVGKVVLVK